MQNEPKKIKVSPSRRVALAGLVTALSLVLLYIDYLLPVLKYSPLAVSSLLPVALAYEKRYADALLAFAATAVLSGLLFRSPDSWPLYVSFFGWYGILREFILPRVNRVLRWLILAAAFNAAFFALYFIVSELFINIRIRSLCSSPRRRSRSRFSSWSSDTAGTITYRASGSSFSGAAENAPQPMSFMENS